MKHSKALFLSLFALMVLGTFVVTQQATAGPENGVTFYVNDPMNRNNVTFKSTAPLEDIVGTTNEITGFLVFDPNNPTDGGHGELMVPVTSLNTGIPLRDEHLQSAGWLNAGEYPEIKLVIDGIKNIKTVKTAKGMKTYDLHVTGKFTLNGKTNTIEFPGRITYLKETEMTKQKMEGNLLAVRTNFEINLSDYNVTGPDGMDIIGSKVGETIAIDVSIMGNTQTKTAADY